jgi:hypothetical protein
LHRGIEGNELANELTITGPGQPLTGPALATGSSDKTPKQTKKACTRRPLKNAGPHLYRIMHTGSVENSATN